MLRYGSGDQDGQSSQPSSLRADQAEQELMPMALEGSLHPLARLHEGAGRRDASPSTAPALQIAFERNVGDLVPASKAAFRLENVAEVQQVLTTLARGASTGSPA